MNPAFRTVWVDEPVGEAIICGKCCYDLGKQIACYWDMYKNIDKEGHYVLIANCPGCFTRYAGFLESPCA